LDKIKNPSFETEDYTCSQGVMLKEVPVINLKADEVDLAKQLRQACINVGFFYLEGHDVPECLMKKVLKASKKLFDLPLDEKLAVQDKEMTRGYTPMEEETLDPASQPERGDTKEGYSVGRDVPKGSKFYNPEKLSGPNMWPTPSRCPSWNEKECEEWKETMNGYFEVMMKLGLRVVQYLALSLGLPKDFFNSSFDAPIAVLRLLHYASEPSDPEQGLFACGAHSDYGMITLLLTDDNPGLQIFTKDEKWIDVPPKKGKFVVNLGDMLERWTNGLFRSTRHRVIIPMRDNYEGSDRYSIPFFFEPNFDTVVECLEVCCRDPQTGQSVAPKYAKTTSGHHLLEKYRQTHADFSPKS